jgi:hypothetical protein
MRILVSVSEAISATLPMRVSCQSASTDDLI